MLSAIWYHFLYQPLFNALVVIYSTIAAHNLGLAVIWLTFLLRIVLLPLTVLSERNTLKRQQAVAEAENAIKAFKNDRVAQAETTRRIMQKYRISPWAKVVSLAVQALVLVLLYQVFVQGVSGERVIKTLYPSIQFPGKINTMFLGTDIGERHNIVWSSIVAVYLLVSIVIENRRRSSFAKSDVYYIIFFPLATFAFLWYLPMVKSLFVLTTMLFSDSVKVLRMLLFSPKKAHDDGHGGHH